MKMINKVLLVLVLAASFPSTVFAAKPVCYSSHNGYCSYIGKVSRIYVNASNQILMYFDTPMDDGAWEVAGISAKHKSAAIIDINSKPEFAKLFYSTALAAQASKRNVQIQMRTVLNGYLVIDRIWLNE